MDNFVRTGFMEGVGYIFSHFLEYLKLFLLTLINSYIIGLLFIIPYLGPIIAFILGIIMIAFIPYGVTLIVCDIKVGFSIYQNFFNFLSVASIKEVVKQYLKLILVFVLIILAIAFVVGVVLYKKGDSLSSLGIVILLALLTIPILSIVSVKMMTTLQLKLISTIYEDDDLEFYHNEAGKYNCMFLWNFVPIINFISLYAICTVFARDIKRYFDL